MKFDEVDLKILSELQKDSRLSMRELSKRVNLSTPSVKERVKRLEENGVIEGYTIKLNYASLGFSISCIMKITIKNGHYQKFTDLIKQHSRSISGYRVSGDACFFILLHFKSVSEIEEFINEIMPLANSATNIVFSKIDINEDVSKFFESHNI
ncbi:Lrp/AsnC family leucine-responsive transcriptional regulator [Bacillus sp. SLBN-46]|jgi:Lrp/AsnC family transcriptional regulator, leucine-responsive regulatory protein|uniref:Lrp/AsnC family transcriptional regulator n=1 Tax=Bacillus sp. SLBN-46 TaxID=3042283 RepID=UPI002854C1EC|nr:Lrp/AsnC family transcriptional regulator [Bacillus sp. SLBN-46]MDR6124102.1 Lrp/AsnC family leucine-responsive transcriptional regulator [Bacillus sp. SLBN-46]